MKEHFEYVAYCLHKQLGHDNHSNEDGTSRERYEDCDEEICQKSYQYLKNL